MSRALSVGVINITTHWDEVWEGKAWLELRLGYYLYVFFLSD